MITKACRYHDISVGHRVVGHEGKCRHLHGHNYRIHFSIEGPKLDSVGRVLDFSVIKEKLCMWLEDNWDHKFLAWQHDDFMLCLYGSFLPPEAEAEFGQSVVWVPFNPTAENMAELLLQRANFALAGSSVRVTKVVIWETENCYAEASK